MEVNVTTRIAGFIAELSGLELTDSGYIACAGTVEIRGTAGEPLGVARFGSDYQHDSDAFNFRGLWVHAVQIANDARRGAFYDVAEQFDIAFGKALNDAHVLQHCTGSELREWYRVR